jgi:hypothetical protein
LEVAVPSSKINNVTIGAVSSVIRALGGDPNDPATTWPESHWQHGFELGWDIRSEVLASNPVHFFVFVSVAGMIVLDRGRRRPELLVVLLGSAGAFVLYSAMLRWQIYSSRQLIPLFVVVAALVGTVLARAPKRVGVTVGSTLLLVGLLFAAENELRPLVPWPAPSILSTARSAQYFADAPAGQEAATVAAVDVVHAAGCGSVEIDPAHEFSTLDYYYVYPVMALLAHDGIDQMRFSGVTNRTAVYGEGGVTNPCAIVCLECAVMPTSAGAYERAGWKGQTFGQTVVYVRPQ